MRNLENVIINYFAKEIMSTRNWMFHMMYMKILHLLDKIQSYKKYIDWESYFTFIWIIYNCKNKYLFSLNEFLLVNISLQWIELCILCLPYIFDILFFLTNNFQNYFSISCVFPMLNNLLLMDKNVCCFTFVIYIGDISSIFCLPVYLYSKIL